MQKSQIEFSEAFIRRLENIDPLQFGLSHEIGYQARRLLIIRFLRGQYIRYNGYDKDKKGRWKSKYHIRGGGTKIDITSYPLNLWSRSGSRRKERPARIMRDLAPMVSGQIAGWSERYYQQFFKKAH